MGGLWPVVVLSTLAFSAASAELMMPAIFKDGVVLQWTAANVFGFADPGDKITVDVLDEHLATTRCVHGS
jgi:hypothetical protein